MNNKPAVIDLIEDAIFDVDGVFTDGAFCYNSETKVYKVFGAHDGDAIKFLRYNNVNIHAITADKRGFAISEARMRDMGIPLTLVSEKGRFEFVTNNFNLATTFFMGDGLHDAEVLNAVKVGVSPSNGCNLAKTAAAFVTERRGGDGAVLEAVEWLAANNFLAKSLEDYLNEQY